MRRGSWPSAYGGPGSNIGCDRREAAQMVTKGYPEDAEAAESSENGNSSVDK